MTRAKLSLLHEQFNGRSYAFNSDVIADLGGQVKDVIHDRVLLTQFVYKVALTWTIETRSRDHAGKAKLY